MVDQSTLRKLISEKRTTLSAEARFAASLEISKRLGEIIRHNKPRWVGSFMPLRDEPQIQIEDHIAHLCYPRVDQADLKFYKAETNGSEFSKNSLGVLEPAPTNEEIQLGDQDMVLVPGVVFNRHGQRIGRGRGYYDRYLSKSRAQRWGVAFDFQLMDEVWRSELWDQSMQGLVTESEILEFNASASKSGSRKE